MKVLHVIPAVAARYGGPSGVVVHMARALQAKGVEVLIATTDADGPGGRLDVPSGVETEWAGAPTIFFPRRGGEAAKLSPALGRWLLGEVRRYDLVHVHAVFSFACAAAAAAALARRRPYVVRPLGTLAPWSLEQKPLRKRLALAAGGRRLLARAAAVHYTTEAERRSTEAALGTRNGVVVPLGVDPALLGPRPPSTTQARPYVLALGRLHPKKRLPALVEAFARARERLPAGARLVLAGEGAPEVVSALRRLADARGLGDRLELPGWVEGDAKRDLLAGAQVLAMPSAQENFGVAAVEALALGVPVVLSEAVDLAELVRRVGCGWVVRGEVDDLAGALIEAFSPDAARLGAAGAELVMRGLTWPRVADQLVALYERVRRR